MYKNLFKESHILTKKMVIEYKLKDYKAQFIICIKFIAKQIKEKLLNIKEAGAEKMENKIIIKYSDFKKEEKMLYSFYEKANYNAEKKEIELVETKKTKNYKNAIDIIINEFKNYLENGETVNPELNSKIDNFLNVNDFDIISGVDRIFIKFINNEGNININDEKNKYNIFIDKLEDKELNRKMILKFLKIDKELIYKNIYIFFQNDYILDNFNNLNIIENIIAIMIYLYKNEIIKL
jgi:hypothetical protein